MATAEDRDASPERGSVGEVVRLFLKLGTIAFGGPAAHIALMHEEVVGRRRWVSEQQFLDLVGATNLIPGPSSTELAIYLGLRRAGWRGLVAAGACFIAPAFAIVLGLAVLYDRYGTTPVATDLLYGVTPVVVAIIAHALVLLGRTAITSVGLAVVGLAALGGYLVGLHPLVLLGVGAVGVAGRDRWPPAGQPPWVHHAASWSRRPWPAPGWCPPPCRRPPPARSAWPRCSGPS